jgi:hypothetical protein
VAPTPGEQAPANDRPNDDDNSVPVQPGRVRDGSRRFLGLRDEARALVRGEWIGIAATTDPELATIGMMLSVTNRRVSQLQQVS